MSSGLKAQQCTLPSRIFLPTPDETKIEQLGQAVDVDQQYMVAGLEGNSTLAVYSGKAIVYKLDADNQWKKIAELTPSDPDKYVQFGNRVSISGNTIVIFGREYTTNGSARGKLYVFNKPAAGEWVSTTESYIIAKGFGPSFAQPSFGQFTLQGDELVTIANDLVKSYIEVYRKSGGIFSLVQTLNIPVTHEGYFNYEWNLTVGDNLIAIGSYGFEHPDNSLGAVFVYEKNSSYNATPVLLRSTEQASPWNYFAMAITAHESTLFVRGLKYDGTNYTQTFYIFERPSLGWSNVTASSLFESPGYVYEYGPMTATDDYLFSAGPSFESILGFKKPAGGWSPQATPFVIDDLPVDHSQAGYQINVTDQHLVVGCPGRFLFTEVSEELIVDYYSPTGAWDDPGLTYQQELRSTSINATDDFFGTEFSVYNDQLAIAASGDDEAGLDAGAVYVFDTQKQSDVPDQKIYNPEQENYTGFGNSIAMGDSLMFIGAPFKDSVAVNGTALYYNIGKVYIYRLTASGWQYSSQIIAPDIHGEVTFGQQVVWSPGYCAVTEFYGGSSESVGRVHIYKENEANGKFDYIATLDPETHLRSDYFGQSMVMTDSLMVIGTGGAAPNSSYRHSVYVFKKKGEWKNATEDASLFSTDSNWSDRFGASVAMYGDYIVVGAPLSPGFDPRPIPRGYIIPGAAYVYKMPAGGWKGRLSEIAKLEPSDPTEYGTFGTSVAIDHNDIFIGSPNVYTQYNYTDKFTNDDNRWIPGKVYHYQKPAGEWTTTGQETRQLMSFEPEPIDGYGARMFVSDRYLFVGAMLDDTPSGFRTGSVQTMMQLPVIDAPSTVCSSDLPIRLAGFPKRGQWSGSGVNAAGVFNPTVAGPGIHTITYQHSGCAVTATIEVIYDQFTVLNMSTPIQVKCIGESIPVIYETTDDAASYMWYYKETLNSSFARFDSLKQRITAVRAGYYQVIITRVLCGTRTVEFTVLDDDIPDIRFGPVPVICENTEIQLSATPESGHWTGSGISGDGIFNPSGLADGSYRQDYEVITAAGCTWNDFVMVQVDILKQPVLQLNGVQVCAGSPVALHVTNTDGRSAISWIRNESEVVGQQVTLVTEKPGYYYAAVSKGTCSLNTLTADVIVQPDSLFVPNVFTANNDTFNDYFEIRSEGVLDFHLLVFNRYGQRIYETSDLAFKWYAEDNVSTGVYYWRATYSTCANQKKELKGWVHVIK